MYSGKFYLRHSLESEKRVFTGNIRDDLDVLLYFQDNDQLFLFKTLTLVYVL